MKELGLIKELESFDSKIGATIELAKNGQFREALELIDELNAFISSIEARKSEIGLVREVALAKPVRKPDLTAGLKEAFPDFFKLPVPEVKPPKPPAQSQSPQPIAGQAAATPAAKKPKPGVIDWLKNGKAVD